MIQKDFQIESKLGLHARPAALFVQLTNKFSSDIIVGKENKIINGKSIMGIMALGVSNGETITVKVSGVDEKEAMAEIEDFLLNKING
ncbi:HPr family phosphocarrier protein [Anaeromicrobium sediminis]|uniref:Phosphocarrier protein HPr n=1 Tax=Anaeromicrobium sediminis TaxID=1478221 RepID=A0A267MEY3_9FIRM|nr:HPr family phosphocarrier protein [Anaeromicrobium sediminis]PAB58144.1 PTS sugar transporter subunit IIA [Anaeromicrobium sediminis]